MLETSSDIVTLKFLEEYNSPMQKNVQPQAELGAKAEKCTPVPSNKGVHWQQPGEA